MKLIKRNEYILVCKRDSDNTLHKVRVVMIKDINTLDSKYNELGSKYNIFNNSELKDYNLDLTENQINYPVEIIVPVNTTLLLQMYIACINGKIKFSKEHVVDTYTRVRNTLKIRGIVLYGSGSFEDWDFKKMQEILDFNFDILKEM